MTVVSGINVKCLQDWSFDFCSQQITPQTALKWYHKDSSLPTMLWFVNWPGSRRCWRSCARSPGKSAGSSGREPRSRAAPCTSHGGPSLRSIATGERSKWYFQRMMISFPLTLFFFLPRPGWCSMRPSARRCCLWCRAPTLLSDPDVHFHSPGRTSEKMDENLNYLSKHLSVKANLGFNFDLHIKTLLDIWR